MTEQVPGPPFAGSQLITVVLPTELESLAEDERQRIANIPVLLHENRAALELELGAPFTFAENDPGEGARWLIGPARYNPALRRLELLTNTPRLFLDRARRLLVSDASEIGDVWDTFSLLRSLARFPGGSLELRDCQDSEEAIERLAQEVGDSYPSFELRGLDWEAICQQYAPQVRQAANPIEAMQEWLAALDDGHTWVRPVSPLLPRPYHLWVTPEQAVFTRVPSGSVAWQAGVQVGYRLVGEDTAGWWRRSPATIHSRPLITGRRLLMGEAGTVRRFSAVSPDSRQQISWDDPVPADPWNPAANWRRLPSGTGYLQIRAWPTGSNLEELVETALQELAGTEHLIVDLRGNTGGDLAMAHRFRNRFLKEAGLMGTIRTRRVDGPGLTEPAPIYGEPATGVQRWLKPVRFLTDALTNSSSEDALLGLQGLPHVQIVGSPSGGSSGRMRILRLLPGWRLTVSTALTYDRAGRCIEGQGIKVDRYFNPDPFSPSAEAEILQYADRDW